MAVIHCLARRQVLTRRTVFPWSAVAALSAPSPLAPSSAIFARSTLFPRGTLRAGCLRGHWSPLRRGSLNVNGRLAIAGSAVTVPVTVAATISPTFAAGLAVLVTRTLRL
jgi:spore coat protein U-like protein